jgi:hypothetical protein
MAAGGRSRSGSIPANAALGAAGAVALQGRGYRHATRGARFAANIKVSSPVRNVWIDRHAAGTRINGGTLACPPHCTTDLTEWRA